MAKSESKAARDNRANQLNPTHPAYEQSRGASPEEAAERTGTSKPVQDNKSRQLNPEDERYHSSRDDTAGDSSTSPDPSSEDSE